MALLEAFKSVVQHEHGNSASLPSNSKASEHRKKLRWLIDSPPADLAKVLTITPELAEAMMERNKSDEWHNRPYSRRALARFAKAMKSGRWILTGEPIIFSKSGNLLNGQHRLMACIESGVSFKSLVVFAIDDEAFKYMDTGTARTAGHIFAIDNIPNANQAAAAARLLFGYKARNNWDGHAPDVDNDVLVQFYYQHERLQDALGPARELYAERLVPFRWGAFLFYICAEKHREQARDFFSKVANGVGLTSKTSPAYLIRKRLSDNARSTSDRLSEAYIGAYFIQAWNAHRRGESRKLFRWRTEQSPNEAFPRAE